MQTNSPIPVIFGNLGSLPLVQKAIENHLKNLWHKRLFGAVLLILKLLVNFRRPKYVLSDLCQPTEKEKQNRRDRPEKGWIKSDLFA